MRWKQRIDQAIRRRVVLHTKDGHSLRGVLWANYPDAVELRAAQYLRDDGVTLPTEGSVLVPTGNVSWIQELGGEQA